VSLYRLVLFVHLVGMIGFFMPLGVYLFGLLALRRASGAAGALDLPGDLCDRCGCS
jgi:hypothetical protein